MNTVDVRNTKYSQGAFWAAGLPVTLVCLALALGAAYREQITEFGSSLTKDKKGDKDD